MRADPVPAHIRSEYRAQEREARRKKKDEIGLREAARAWERASGVETPDPHDRAFAKLDRALQRAAVRFAASHPEMWP